MSNLSTRYRSGTKVKHQLFTSNGTWTKPSKFIEGTLLITGIGGGASGCSLSSQYATAGNSGEYVYEMYLDVTAISSASVTIGTGGASPAYLSAGNSGNPTTFGALLTLSGGIGATTAGVQATSVGGARGGWGTVSGTAIGSTSQSLPCAKGGVGGCHTAGDMYNTGSQVLQYTVGGGGGLVLDGSGTAGGNVSGGGGLSLGGVGYGAGGGAYPNAAGGVGANGAIFLTWQEYV